MNKDFFQQVFRAQRGYVYRYTGTVPDGESAEHYITDKFATSVDTNLLNTVVVELPRYGVTVIYADTDENLNTSTEFELITDLIPVVVIEQPTVSEEVTPPTVSEEVTPPTEG